MDQDLQDMLHLAETAKLPLSNPHVSIDNHYRFYRVDLVPDSGGGGWGVVGVGGQAEGGPSLPLEHRQ